MDEYEIECDECGWQGYAMSLLCNDDDFQSDKRADQCKFNICPDCGAVDKFSDIEYDEDE